MGEATRVETIVVGGGLAGLVCTWRLAREGIDAICLESTERVGGALLTHRRDGFVVEGGATTVQETPLLAELVREVGMEEEVRRTAPKLSRFIYRNGVLQRVPQSVSAMIASRLLSTTGKLRVIGEIAIRGGAGAREESIAEFVTRRFGAEVLESLVAPLVSGTFAGDPAKLGVEAVFPRLVDLERTSGSILRGMLAGGTGDPSRRTAGSLVSFRDGLGSLAERIAERLGDRVRRRSRVSRLLASEAGYRVTIVTASSEIVLSAASVVLAVPAWTAAELAKEVAPVAATALGEIDAPRLACVSLAWPASDVAHPLDGLGFLVSPRERVRILGCLWLSSMFDGRAPAGIAMLTSFVGGARDPAGADLDDRALVATVAADLGTILGTRGDPRVLSIDRYDRAIPQYTIGHRLRIERMRAGLTRAPGLFLCGNYLDGIAVGEAARQGVAAAGAVTEFRKTAVDFSRRGV